MHTSGSYHALQPQVLQISLSGSQLPTSSTLHVRSGVCLRWLYNYSRVEETLLFFMISLRCLRYCRISPVSAAGITSAQRTL